MLLLCFDPLTNTQIKPTIVAAVAAQDLFAQIANDDPVQVLGGTIVNQVAPVSLDASYGGLNGKAIQTNKFYGNLLNGDRTQTVFTMPYSLFWSKSSNGLCVSNAANTDYAFGPNNVSPTYYYSPIFRCPIGFTSAEMDSAQTMSLGNLQPHSVDVTFAPSSNAGKMKTTLTQGSAFISMTYTNLQPVLFSGTGAFTSLSPVTFKVPLNTNGVSKYRVTSNNGDTWLVYVFQSGGPTFSLAISSGTAGSRLLGSAGFSGTIQIAKLPTGFTSTDEAFYDSGAGTFPTTMVLTGSASGKTASYTFDYQPTSLISNPLLTYLFPHQQQSVSSGAWSDLKLWSTTKGLMRARFGNTLTFSEANLPIDIQFLPWSPLGNLQNYSAPALQAIAAAANNELKQSISQQSNLADLYFSGKALAKFAQICLAVKDVLGADASDCVSRLEAATETFTNGNNQNPLRYDVTWKGAISSCGEGQTLDTWKGCGFGNPTYNDHHFHASYVVYTAAVLAHLDPAWLSRGKNKAYVNTLIRDFANPSSADTAFPVFRSFDWVAGHSWAHGVLASGDGKDEESSSEDYNAYYAMKLWGKVIGDTSMEARGNLMLSIMSRSMQSYMLMAKDNTVQPPNFLHNYVSGITFENKVDHTTYFGTNTEYIHGIHMLPLTPMSAFIRTPTFVAQEWDAVLKPITPQVEGTGWSGILWANLAISNSTASFNYFANPTFNSNNLDGGASLTWYLTYAAG
ncbi:endo-1,3(4)-beta-glucanase, partial [Protomyces lactucae-debilis]